LEAIGRAEQKLRGEFADRMSVNQDLDRTLVSFQANKKEVGHRWCKYKEGFSADLVRYILRKADLVSGLVLDPFAGSGTTLFVASECGLDAVGIELLPNSAEVIEVRSLIAGCDPAKLSADIQKFLRRAAWEAPGKSAPFPHLRITSGAFPKETEFCLGRYLFEVNRLRDKFVQRVLRFAAMCILEPISYTRKDGQYLRWDQRSGRCLGRKKFDKGPLAPFGKAIRAKLDQIVTDLGGQSGLLFDTAPKTAQAGRIELLRGSCLDILPTLRSRTFDGLITSPPYCNRYDYTRTYALELAMLGVGEEELRRLRQAMLSCTVENRDKTDLAERFSPGCYGAALSAFESQEVLSLILEYLEQCKTDGAINNSGIPRMVRNYFLESALVICESARVLKPEGVLVMVNDNVRYQGARVPVDLILSDFAQQAGFNVEAIWVLPKGKGNSSQQMGLHGREEVRKCVYVWRLKAHKPTR
jgi:DNA modification methylase